MKTELYSFKERMAYSEANAKIIKVGNNYFLATPKGEPLLTRVI